MKGVNPLFSDYSGGRNNFGATSENYSNSNAYSSSLKGESQSYKKEYSVYAKMMKKDIKHGVYIIGSGYSKNPTAQDLSTLVKGNYINDKNFNIKVPYVITKDGNVIIGKRNGNGRNASAKPTPHPTLIGGKDPKVRMAGIIDIRGGKIFSYDNQSGHFRPNPKSIKWADTAFSKFPKHKKFKGAK